MTQKILKIIKIIIWMVKKYVLTGAACSGKTTLLKLLEKDYQTVPEAARMVIRKELERGSEYLPWKNILKFQILVCRKQIELESRIDPNGKDVFLDRGIPDGIAYLIQRKIPPPKELLEAAERNKYDKVFLLEILPNFVKDNERREDEKKAKGIKKYLANVYSELGYETIEVPVMSVEERKEFILKRI